MNTLLHIYLSFTAVWMVAWSISSLIKGKLFTKEAAALVFLPLAPPIVVAIDFVHFLYRTAINVAKTFVMTAFLGLAALFPRTVGKMLEEFHKAGKS